MTLKKVQIISAGDLSQATVTSSIVDISGLEDIGVQMNFTGTPTGTFIVQVSIDHQQDLEGNVTVAGNWCAILPAPTALPATGAAGSLFLNLPDLCAPYLRVQYTKVSGTGVGNVFVCGKSV